MGHLYRVGVWKRMIYDISLWKLSFKKFRKVFPKIKVFLSKCLKEQMISHSLFCVHVFLVNKTWMKYVFVMYYWINQFLEKHVYFNQFPCSLYTFTCIFFLQWRCICFCKQVVYIVLRCSLNKKMFLNILIFFTLYWLKKIYLYKNIF